jgi:hypothetical protein
MNPTEFDIATIVAALELLKNTNEGSLPPKIKELATMDGSEKLMNRTGINGLIDSIRSSAGVIRKNYEYHFDSGLARGRDAAAMMNNAICEFLNEDGISDLADDDNPSKITKAAHTFIHGFMVGLGENFADGEFDLSQDEFIDALKEGVDELSLSTDSKTDDSPGSDGECSITEDDFLEQLSTFVDESKDINGVKDRIIFDVRIALDHDNNVWVGFLTPDEFALAHPDLGAQHLQQDYIHWFESHLVKATKFLQENKIGFRFFSEVDFTNTSNLVERGDSHLEVSPHEFESPKSPKQCVGLLISNGEISICTILMFMSADGELIHQKNLFSLQHLKGKESKNLAEIAYKVMDEVNSICKKEGCHFIGLRATNALVFCEEHRAITANLTALVSDDDQKTTPSTLLH